MRYERQIIMEEVGEKGQESLANAMAAVIGCGGLGSPVLTYLAAAGVGTIKIIDSDIVTESNLNRQFLHWPEDIGRKKTESVREKLVRFNPQIRILTESCRLDKDNCEKLLTGADVAVDCVDNIETRLLVNRACLKQDIPLVEGGIRGFFGCVMAVSRDTACLECVGYQHVEAEETIPSLGAVAGVIGSLQAVEAVKIILGKQEVLFGKILNYDGRSGTFYSAAVPKKPDCKAHQFE